MVEFGGMKFNGKIFVILTLLTLHWIGAEFEFYKDYMDMREKIETLLHQTYQTMIRE